MSRQLGRIALLLCALSLQACGDEPGPTTEPMLAGAAGAGGVAGTGGGPAQMSGAGGAAAGQAGASVGLGGAMACSSYADDLTWTLQVTIKNEMSQTLYLGQETSSCEAQRLFQVEDGARTVLPLLQACRSSCQTMMETGPVVCPGVCATPATVTLEPGQTIQVPWDGRFGVESSLPQQCMVAGQSGPATCVRAERVEANAFTFSARAGTRRQCLEPSGACACSPNPTGGCTAPGSLIAGTIITTELFLKLEPGEPATSGEPPYIGLVFKDQ